MEPTAVWSAAIVNTSLGCLVQQLSQSGNLDGAALVEGVQEIAGGLRKIGHIAVADAMHQIAIHLLKSDEPLHPRG